jgi:hypothetical protein
MKKLMHRLFLSCLKATELIEKRLHFKLSRKEKLQLKVHKMMCSACSNYEKQSIFIEKGISINQKREFSEDDIQQLKLIITEKISDTK